MALDEASSPSIWAVMKGWLNPSVLFVVLNVVIGVIAITSKGIRSRQRHGGAGVGDEGGERHMEAPKLQRSASSVVFERLRSLGLFHYRSGEMMPPSETTHERAETVHVAPDPEPHPNLYRSPSSMVFERLRSLGLYRDRSGEIKPESSEAVHEVPDPEPLDHHLGRSQSESRATEGEGKEKATVKVRKSASAKSVSEEKQIRRRPVAPVAAEEDEEEPKEVDVRADDFISRFRQQLNLQRLDSFARYKEMLHRGR